MRDVVPAEGVEPRHILDLKVCDWLTPVAQSNPGSCPQITNEALTELLRLVPLGLAAMFDLPLGPSAETTTEAPIAVLLPPSPSTALPLLLLQLASPPGCPIIPLPSPTLLDAALNSTAHARPRVLVVYVDLLEEALEQAFEDKGEGVGALVVGDPDMGKRDIVERARRKGMKVHWWEDMWEEGEKSSAEVPGACGCLQPEQALTREEGKFDSTQAYFYHSSGAGKEPTCTKFSHIVRLALTLLVLGAERGRTSHLAWPGYSPSSQLHSGRRAKTSSPPLYHSPPRSACPSRSPASGRAPRSA